MKKFLCVILVAVTLVSTLGVAPEEAFAEKAYVEKQVGYDNGSGANTMCKKQKDIYVNIDKISANDFVKKVYKYGKKGIKEKVIYTMLLSTNERKWGKVVSDKALKKYEKKVKAFTKKVMKASANKYGISMGLRYGSCVANEVIYCEKLFDAILQDKITKNVGTAYASYEIENSDIIQYINIKYSDLFKNAADVKKLSDSAKLHLFCGAFSGDTTRLHYTQKYSCSYSFELLWKKTIKGACSDFTRMWCYFAEYICDEVVASNVTCSNHVYALIGVKNAKGNWEYFKGNTELFGPWSQTKLGRGYSFKDKSLGKKALKWAKTSGAYKDWDEAPSDFDKIYKKEYLKIADKYYAEAAAEKAAEEAKEAEYTATVVAPPTTSTWNGIGDNPYYTYE